MHRPLAPVQAIQEREQTPQVLSGIWRKDKSASDSMDEACDAVKLKWILRRGLAILNTLEVEWHPDVNCELCTYDPC